MATDKYGVTKFARNSQAYQKLRREFKERCRRQNAQCARCLGDLGDIDYSAPPNTSRSFEVGHIKPVSTHPHLAMVIANWRPEHCACNRSAQARDVREQNAGAVKSGKWVRPTW